MTRRFHAACAAQSAAISPVLGSTMWPCGRQGGEQGRGRRFRSTQAGIGPAICAEDDWSRRLHAVALMWLCRAHHALGATGRAGTRQQQQQQRMASQAAPGRPVHQHRQTALGLLLEVCSSVGHVGWQGGRGSTWSAFRSHAHCSATVRGLLKELTSEPTNARLGTAGGIMERYRYIPSRCTSSLCWVALSKKLRCRAGQGRTGQRS
jgi:hypothetical protein